MRYADPSLCPDCRASLGAGVARCAACGLVVRHPLAVELFGTLQRADHQLERLRRLAPTAPTTSAASPQPAPGVTPPTLDPRAVGTRAASTALPPFPGPRAAPLPSPGPAPATRTTSTGGTGLRDLMTVPRLLLGLGALCLLVAAVVFLGVSWSLLGVAGRTGVLAALTAVAATATAWAARRGLRLAAEAFSAITLGLLALDLAGAGASGWLGTADDGARAAIAGSVVLAAATAWTLVAARRRVPLLAPQVAAAPALLVAYLGATQIGSGHGYWPAHATVGAAVIIALLDRAVRRQAPSLLVSATAAVAGLAWTVATIAGMVQVVRLPDVASLLSLTPGGWLLLSAAWLLAPGLVLRAPAYLRAGAAAAGSLLSLVALLPVLDEGAQPLGWTVLALTAAWTTAAATTRGGARRVALVPATAGALVLTGSAILSAVTVLGRWTALLDSGGGLQRTLAVRLPVDGTFGSPLTDPLTLLPSAVLVGVVGLLHAGLEGRRPQRAAALRGAALVVVLAVALTLGCYAVPLALPVGLVTLTALACAAATLRGSTATAPAARAALAALGLAVLAALAAWPSAPLAALAASAGAAVAVTIAAAPGARRVQERATATVVAGLLSAPLLAAGTAAALVAGGAVDAWLAVPVLLAVSLLALAMPRVEVEASAAVSAAAVLPLSLAAATDGAALTALWLAVAGGALCASSLLHHSRRTLLAPGCVLLLVAAWVRLIDLQVHAPEAYTLPIAAALLGLGLRRMRTTDIDSVPALLPGLLLATVPTLLWVFAEPLALRAAVLGLGCVALLVAGSTLRWTAPLAVGGTVLALLALRALGPYAGSVPTWAWLAAAGAVLTVVGTTWEQRLVNLREARGVLERLR